MIFKKPYKFLIKNFRMIHLIIAILSMYLSSKTNNILNFFYEYATSSALISVVDLSNQLFNSLMFVIPIIVIIGIAIIIYLLYWKEKPVKFYIFNIIVYIIIIICYIYINSVCKTLEVGVVDIRIIKIIGDVSLVLFFVQIISAIFFIVRALGFDVKKFNFGKDLGLEVSTKDNEEFEFNVNFNSNKTKRDLKRNIRNAKYVYKENKFLINIMLLILIVIISISLYLYYGVFNKNYKNGDVFTAGTVSVKVKDVFTTNEKYNRNKITDNMLVVIRLETKGNYLEENKLEPLRFQLMVNNIPFNHTENYSKDLVDFGTTYKNQTIGNKELEEYLLVFEIPKEYSDKKMTLQYLEFNNKKLKINIKTTDLEKKNNENVAYLGNSLNIKNDVIGDFDINIDTIEIANKMKINYYLKISDTNFQKSYEYIIPSYSDNYEKTLMKITGYISCLDDNKNKKLYSLYDFINYFGIIEYVVNGETKKFDYNLRKVSPLNVKLDNEFYIEVDKNIEKAESITLIFNIRNDVYKYKLK